MILSNMCKDPSSKTAKNFISMQAEAAIDSVLDILSRNMGKFYFLYLQRT